MKTNVVKGTLLLAAVCLMFLAKAQHVGGANTNGAPGSNYVVTHTNISGATGKTNAGKKTTKGTKSKTGNQGNQTAPAGNKGNPPHSNNSGSLMNINMAAGMMVKRLTV